MSLEIELKFALQNESIDKLSDFFSAYRVLSQQHYYLTNSYLETADSYLRRHGCGLRLRGTGQDSDKVDYELTMKREGNSIAGLHQRLEFNVALTDDQVDIALLPQEAFPNSADIKQLQVAIKPLFTTNFHRQIWLIEYQGSEIEVAFDRGVISANTESVPIQEIELELKQGSAQALIEFALLLSPLDIRLFALSKAARGYGLAQNKSLSLPALTDFSLTDKTTVFDALIINLQSILTCWQEYEEYLLANDQQRVLRSVVEIIIRWLKEVLVTFAQYLYVSPAMMVLQQIALLQGDLDQKPRSVEYLSNSNELKLMLIDWLINPLTQQELLKDVESTLNDGHLNQQLEKLFTQFNKKIAKQFK